MPVQEVAFSEQSFQSTQLGPLSSRCIMVSKSSGFFSTQHSNILWSCWGPYGSAWRKKKILLLFFRLGGGKFDHYSFTLQTVETCSKWGSYVLPFPQHIQHPLLFSALLAAEAALAKSRRTLGHAVVASPDSLTT